MYINDVEFSDELIDAIKNDRLVVFAGAGVSKGKPAGLPDFTELCKKLAYGSGEKYEEDKINPDKFLGRLEEIHKVNIRSKTCKYLNSAETYNEIHQMILKLFKNKSIRLITTNYDNLFEKAIKKLNLDVKIYDNPALPFGNDFTGLVHIHGNVKDPKNMIITDEDFGKGYMSEGQISRFLVKVFENYHILFVGYSYNDTIMNYLTRALFRNDKYKRYILSDDTKNDWGLLGIKLLAFPHQQYDVLNEVLNRVGLIVNSNYSQWEVQAREIASNEKDKSTYDLLKYHIKDDIKLYSFLKVALFDKWCIWFDENGYFDNLFNPKIDLLARDESIIEWFLRDFEKNYILMKKIFAKHSKFNPGFVKKIISSLSRKEIDIKILRECSIFIADKVERYDRYTYMFIDTLFNKNLDFIAIELFKKELEPCFKMKDSLIFTALEDVCRIEHIINCDIYQINKIWKKHSHKICNYKYGFFTFIIQLIEKIHHYYETVEMASNEIEPYPMLFARIEPDENSYSRNNIFVLLAKMFEECIENCDESVFKIIIDRILTSNSSLVRKIALVALRKSKFHSPEEKMLILLDNEKISFFYDKEYIFKLVAEIYNKIDEEMKNKFLDRITVNIDSTDELKLYEIYNWAVWLCEKCNNPKELNLIKENFENKYGFKPRKFPELNIYVGNFESVKEFSIVSKEEMLSMKNTELIDMVINYNPNNYEGETRQGFITTLAECFKENYTFTYGFLKEAINTIPLENDIWDSLFLSLTDSNYSLTEMINVCNLLTTDFICKYDIQLYRFIRKFVEKNEVGKKEELIIELINKISKMSGNGEILEESLHIQYFNSSAGEMLECYFALLYKNKVFHDKFKTIFTEILEIDDSNRYIYICGIVGHIAYFYSQDRVWTRTHLFPYLSNSNDDVFKAAWEGFALFSSRLNEDFALDLINIFLDAMDRIELLSEDSKESFISKSVILSIYVIENPLIDFIPKLLTNLNDMDIEHFYNSIYAAIEDQDERINLFNLWFKEFIILRIEKGNQIELNQLTFLALEYDDLFEFIINKLIDSGNFKELDSNILYEILESDQIEKHGEILANFLVMLMENQAIRDIYFLQEIIDKIKILSLSKETKDKLREACIKNKIVF